MSIDIRNLNRQLSQLITNPPVGSKRRPAFAIKILNQLREQPMTMELLVKTKVGLTVSSVRDKMWSLEVFLLCNKVIREWKQLVPKYDKNGKKRIHQKKSSDKKVAKNVKTTEEKIKSTTKCETTIKKVVDPSISAKEMVDRLLTETAEKTAETSAKIPEKKSTKRPVANKLVDKLIDIAATEQVDKPVNKQLNTPVDKPLKNEEEGRVYKGKEKKKIQSQVNASNESNKENVWNKSLKSILKKKNTFTTKTFEPKIKKFKKLPPIGQMPEFSAERLREKRIDAEFQDPILGQPSTSKGSLITSSVANGVGGHQLYEKIVRKRKLERTSKMDSPRKRAMTFATVAVEKYNLGFYKPKVLNLPVPHSVPVLTPADRLKIIQTRDLEKPFGNEGPSTSKVVAFKDEHEIELDTWRVRSAKSLTRIIPRKEHRPKWLPKK